MAATPIPDWALKPVPLDTLRKARQLPAYRKADSVALWVPDWDRGQPMRTQPTFDAAVNEGWRRNELIFACIMKTMKARASVRMCVESAGSDKELPDHPFMALIQRPNPYMSEFAFHANVVMFQKLSGHSYWEVIRSRAGMPVQLWPLRPDWTKPVVNNSGLVGWEYQRGGQTTDVVRLGPRDVLDISMPDPTSIFGGTSPVAVAGYSGDIDNAVSAFARDFFLRGALPYGVLTTEQYLDADDITEAQLRWEDRYGGGPGRNVRAPAILPKGQSYQNISMSFEQMGFEALDSRDEVRICMVMDIPPILVGANVGLERATYSNYEQARESWWQDSILPDLMHEADALLPLALEFGQDVELRWDTSEVVALQEDEAAVHEQARSDLAAGAITLDEARERMGLDPLPKKAGQIFLRPINVLEVPVGDVGRVTPPSTQPPADATVPPTDATAATDASKADQRVIRNQAAIDVLDAILAKADPPHDQSARQRHEARMRASLSQFFAGELERIAREMGNANPG